MRFLRNGVPFKNACVTNRTIRKCQHTVQFHMDDVLSSHTDTKVSDNFTEWAQTTYGAYKLVEVYQGKIHHFWGMMLDFSKRGEVHVTKNNPIDELIED